MAFRSSPRRWHSTQSSICWLSAPSRDPYGCILTKICQISKVFFWLWFWIFKDIFVKRSKSYIFFLMAIDMKSQVKKMSLVKIKFRTTDNNLSKFFFNGFDYMIAARILRCISLTLWCSGWVGRGWTRTCSMTRTPPSSRFSLSLTRGRWSPPLLMTSSTYGISRKRSQKWYTALNSNGKSK